MDAEEGHVADACAATNKVFVHGRGQKEGREWYLVGRGGVSEPRHGRGARPQRAVCARPARRALAWHTPHRITHHISHQARKGTR